MSIAGPQLKKLNYPPQKVAYPVLKTVNLPEKHRNITITRTQTQTKAKDTHGDRIFNITCSNGTVLKIHKTTVKLHFRIRLQTFLDPVPTKIKTSPNYKK